MFRSRELVFGSNNDENMTWKQKIYIMRETKREKEREIHLFTYDSTSLDRVKVSSKPLGLAVELKYNSRGNTENLYRGFILRCMKNNRAKFHVSTFEG